jgi:hypothetical protein
MSDFSRPACAHPHMKSDRQGRRLVLEDVLTVHFVELNLHEAWKATGRFTMNPRDLVDNFLPHVSGDHANWRYTLIKRHVVPSFASSLGR